jgi:hypothetical protein
MDSCTHPEWLVVLTDMQLTDLEKHIPDIRSRAVEQSGDGPLSQYSVPLTGSESNHVLDFLGEEPIRVESWT